LSLSESPTQPVAPYSLIQKLKGGAIFFLAALLLTPVLIQLAKIWSAEGDYSHGFFVIPISFYMVWSKREKLLAFPLKPLWAGFPVFLIGVFFYVIAFITRFHTLTYLSILLLIFGLLLFMIGWDLTRELLVPLLFLAFMFPVPSAYYVLITNPLKLFITKMSVNIISLIGIPVYREGNLLFVASTQLEVADACSGVRSLYSYLMLGCLFAWLSKGFITRLVLIISTVLLAIIVNVLRISGTGVLSNYYGAQVAQGFFHEFTGFVFFVFGFAVLLVEYVVLNRKASPHATG
jgi:exosortase